jgi:hypothetical protein
LIWNQDFGTAIQSQTGSNNAAWGTLLGQNQVPFEGDTLNVGFRIGTREVIPIGGNRDLGDGPLLIRYGFPDQGEKTITFGSSNISVDIQRSGTIREQIPLLVGPRDELKVEAQEIKLKHGAAMFLIRLNSETKVEPIETYLRVGQRRVVTLLLRSTNILRYSMSFGDTQ